MRPRGSFYRTGKGGMHVEKLSFTILTILCELSQHFSDEVLQNDKIVIRYIKIYPDMIF